MPFRAATAADEPALTALFRAAELAAAGRAGTTAPELRAILDAPDLRSAVADRDGAIVGFAALHAAAHVGHLRAHLATAPGEPADPLLDRIAGWAGGAKVTLFQLPGATTVPALRGRGWKPVRRYTRLTADLTTELPAPADAAAGVRILAAGEPATVHAVIEDAVAGHWQHRPRDFADFWRDQRGIDGHDPTLWWLAEVDGRPAAALIARGAPGRAWIGWFGTREPYRGRGLGRALLLTAFAELARRGHRTVGVDVDSANETGAPGVYRAAGMRVLGEADQWLLA